jgi:alpha-tubulin suppressor-like RCC1 family protein
VATPVASVGWDPSICIEKVALGSAHSCAVRADGWLFCWGRNRDGQIGNGTTENQYEPVAVAALGNQVTDVELGENHTCAVTADQALWCWGQNIYGQLGTRYEPGQVSHALPLRVDALGTDVAQVALGAYHTCAIELDGSAWCWGRGESGELGDGSTSSRSTPGAVSGLDGSVAEIGLGAFHGCARKTDGSLACWGDNSYAQIADGSREARLEPVPISSLGSVAAELAVGAMHTCVRTIDGSLFCWGENDQGQLGDGTTTTPLEPVRISTLGTSVAGVAVAPVLDVHICVHTLGNQVWCWGNNDFGQLGDGTMIDRATPTALGDALPPAARLALGGYTTCQLSVDGSVHCWGINGDGQLGDGTSQSHDVPTSIAPSCSRNAP